MTKSTFIYSIGLLVLVGRVTYLLLNNTTEDPVTMFATQQEQIVHTQGSIEQQREAMNESDLEKAAQQLATSEYSTTSITTDQGMHDLELLEKLYQQETSDSLAALLLQYYRQELFFDKARDLLERHPSLLNTQLSRQETLHLYANTSTINVRQSTSVMKLSQKVREYSSQNYLSLADQQRYDALMQLRDGDVPAFLTSIQQVDHPYYQAVKGSILHNQSYAEGQRDIPAYYLQALIGLSLLQHQYLPFAEKVALDVIAQDPNYILPYQILAYTTFLQRDREQSTHYIRELLARDSQQRPVYQFMLGVIAYRQQQYQEAILYFVGVEDPTLEADTHRYLALSYLATNDIPQATNSFAQLANSTKLTPSDYYHYFYRAYFHPYRSNTSYALLDENRVLALRFQQLCHQQLDTQRSHVCDYGEVGQLIVSQQYDQAFKRLLYLAKYYPQSYFFEALGDYYQQQGKTQQAIMYYLQAMRYTKDSIERIDATQKIRELVPAK